VKTQRSEQCLKIEFRSLEVLFPEDRLDKRSNTLLIQTQGLITMESTSLYKNYYKEGKMIQSDCDKSDSDLEIQLKQLQMFIQKRQRAEKYFFLHPYDLSIKIGGDYKMKSEDQDHSKTTIEIQGSEIVHVTVGFKEFNSYLLLCQQYFQFNNEYYGIWADVNRQIKDYMNYWENYYNKIEQNSELQQSHTLDKILADENLVKLKKQSSLNRMRKAVVKTIDKLHRRDFYESLQKIKIKGLKLEFVDNLAKGERVPLLSLEVRDFGMDLKMRSYDTIDLFKMERMFQQQKFHEKVGHYFEFDSNFLLGSDYYNRNSQAIEPFIEPLRVSLTIDQATPLTQNELKIETAEFLNINFTYGFACTMQKFFKKLVAFEKQ